VKIFQYNGAYAWKELRKSDTPPGAFAGVAKLAVLAHGWNDSATGSSGAGMGGIASALYSQGWTVICIDWEEWANTGVLDLRNLWETLTYFGTF
jgi:hypothetical protein